MSRKHPIIAVTGSSGAGTSTVKRAVQHIFDRISAKAEFVEGDSFHRYNRKKMRKQLKIAESKNRNLSHFGPEGNRFDKQFELFRSYAENGMGMRRRYVHDEEEAALYGGKPGTFTNWEQIKEGSDLLFYEGLHGGVITDEYNIASKVDLLIGVAPTINLEWIQKINRDTAERGYESKVVMDTIYRRMYDYMHYILPQFERTHINFQRIPLVDTSNPFMVRDIPSSDQSQVLIHFLKHPPSMGYKLQLKGLIEGSFISGFNTLVIPGGKMKFALELILTQRITGLMERRSEVNVDRRVRF